MLILKFSGEGEIFFLQNRIGRNKKEFNYILFSNHSISLLPVEKIMIHKALKEASNFELYDLNSE